VHPNNYDGNKYRIIKVLVPKGTRPLNMVVDPTLIFKVKGRKKV